MTGFGKRRKSKKQNTFKKDIKPSKDQIINQAIEFHLKGNISEAVRYYQYCLDQGFNDPKVFSNYGAILQDLGKLKEAENSYRKAIQLKPDLAEFHSNLGNTLKDLGRLEEAEISTRKAIKLNPNFANAHSNLGLILRDLGKSEEAEISTREAIKLNPNFANAHSNLGLILRDLGKSEEAEISTREAIKLNPNFANAHSNLGLILKDLGKLKEAEKSTLQAIKLNPASVDSYINLGTILRDLGKLKEAEILYRKSIELNPLSAVAYYNLGNILRDLGKLEEAELSTRKAIELNPDYAMAHSNLGTILDDLGNLQEAMIHWEKAIQLKPEDDISVMSLSYQLCFDKKYELAIKYLSKNKSESCQSLYLDCLLSLDREKDFNVKYNELYEKNSCNAHIGGVVEHANIIYEKKYKSTFCDKAIKYVLIDRINEESFSSDHLNELISYNKSSKKEVRSQGLLSNGIQTSGNLFLLDYPFIKAIKKALEEKIQIYKNNFIHSGQGFIENWPRDYELRAWMISMKNGGFLKQHNHEYGWITGSFYLKVPTQFKNEHEGNLAFSYEGPRYPSKDKDFNLTIKKITTRDICIFPSSLFHHTIPFQSEEERICFVFDLVQKR